MVSRKRARDEVDSTPTVAPPSKEPGILERLRNMWQFANLAQWLYIFGKAVKLDEDVDIEELEVECLKPHSTKLSEIGLALLKFISSHRGLTPEIFDEYTRRQYVARAPERNPYGTEEQPAKFADFDIFTKIQVLQQLTQWTFNNPDRIRERMEEQKEADQAFWRVEPFGWDSEDRTYVVLDDNRLYRLTEPPPPPAPKAAPKKNSKKARAAARASKRRRVSKAAEASDEDEVEQHEEAKEAPAPEDNGLGGSKWECLAVTFDELNSVVTSLAKSRDPNEKALRQRIIDDLLPLLEKHEESRKRKQAQKDRELLNMEKLSHAKRSSRIAGRQEQQRQEEEAREAERKHQADLAMARKEQESWKKTEKDRESRMQTREQRLKEREARRILHEEELANLSEDNKKVDSGESRMSERHLKAEIEKKRRALEQLQGGNDWVFDCICGAYGHVDDGTLSIACERCSVWQHTKCVGVRDEDAARDDFHFVCESCRHRAKEEKETENKPSLKFKLGRPSSSALNAPPPLEPTALGEPEMERSQPSSPVKSRLVHSSPSRPPYESPYSNSHAPIPFSQRLTAQSTPFPDIDRRPTSQGSIQGAPAWPPNVNGSTPNRPAFGAQFNGHNAFSSPLPDSPISLPPAMAQSYSTANGHNLGATPASSGSRHTHDQTPRRTSMSFASPLATAPVLSPPPNSATKSPPAPSDTPAQASEATNSTPAPQHMPTEATYQTAPLPPTQAGISPTKQSPPPRPSTANGSNFGSVAGTPNHIPPVVPLSPSPMMVDLSPPVKQSEPERSRASIGGGENANGNGGGNGVQGGLGE